MKKQWKSPRLENLSVKQTLGTKYIYKCSVETCKTYYEVPKKIDDIIQCPFCKVGIFVYSHSEYDPNFPSS